VGDTKPLQKIKKEIKKGELNHKGFLMRKENERRKVKKKYSYSLPKF